MRRFSSKSDPVVEVEVEMTMDKAPEVDIKPKKQKMEKYIILEEDP
jgi:hypothetical protein